MGPQLHPGSPGFLRFATKTKVLKEAYGYFIVVTVQIVVIDFGQNVRFISYWYYKNMMT